YIFLIGLLLLLSLPFRWLAVPRNLQSNEAMSIIALAFIISPFFSLITFTGSGLDFHDAMFEAISAITTTGLSTVVDPLQMSKTFQFARSWMQWYGGLGIIIFSLAFFMGHHSTARKFAESLASENLLTTARTYARRVFFVYSALTLCAIVVLALLSGDVLWSIVHALSAVSTGGFSNLQASLGGVDSHLLVVLVSLACLAGAIPLAIYFQATHGEWRKVLENHEIQLFVVLVVVVTVLLTVQIKPALGIGWHEALFHGFAMGASAQSTAGFSTLNINQLDSISHLTMIVSMFIGGNVGSTAGGVKILHLIIFLRLFQVAFQRATLPHHAVWENKLHNQPLGNEEIIKVLLLIIAFVFVIFFSWALFLWYDYPPVPALFEVVSAAMTVGLSSGITSAELEPVLKWVLCINMWLGRVEILAMLLLLYPRNWIGRKAGVK
ncbi:MAG: potassium transporter TrkG, partial [Ketobacteraceae bacterium]|nr:potassium transporter TrkG [Ketobacteraceae bacterium]